MQQQSEILKSTFQKKDLYRRKMGLPQTIQTSWLIDRNNILYKFLVWNGPLTCPLIRSCDGGGGGGGVVGVGLGVDFFRLMRWKVLLEKLIYEQ